MTFVSEINQTTWTEMDYSLIVQTSSNRIEFDYELLKQRRAKATWTKEEDERLIRFVHAYGFKKWTDIALHFEAKNGKQCRERWYNYVNPEIKKTAWTEEEDTILREAHSVMGNKWTKIAKYLPGRSDNAIKNRWNCAIRRQKAKKNRTKQNLQMPPDVPITTPLPETCYTENTVNCIENTGQYCELSPEKFNFMDTPKKMSAFEQLLYTPPKIKPPSIQYDKNLNEYTDTKSIIFDSFLSPKSDEFETEINNVTPVKLNQPSIETPRTPTPFKNSFVTMKKIERVKCQLIDFFDVLATKCDEQADSGYKIFSNKLLNDASKCSTSTKSLPNDQGINSKDKSTPSFVKKINFGSNTDKLPMTSLLWESIACGKTENQVHMTNLAYQYLSSF